MTPPRPVSIGQKISAFIVIIGTFLLISFWPVQKENLSSDQSTASSAESSSSSSESISSSTSSKFSSVGMETMQSSSSTSMIDSRLQKIYSNEETGFSFSYGDTMTVTAPTSFVLGKGEIGYQINDPSHYGEIWVSLSPDVSHVSEGVVRMEEVYSPPGGNLSKNYVLFTGKYKVSVYAHYDVFPLYEHQIQPGSNLSLSELVHRDLGDDVTNPIKRLMAIYPQEKTLIDFYTTADQIVASMRSK